ncbi:hypothetical protein GPECTOR_8g176 [Gonium pectorale]|uniref:Guanylate cyclase domain-containing protein n=1 Tax=Gonium pectorale TaxID=33097 RepID=A0A150GSX2_GONPE|nr:hypothetical protein GPECTOR_8g176 [Gonium pectorale]|eukprot:KXZ52788.1 hypothetical protein GPECTOR_8g176 [Gonium pectorale]
MGRPQHQPDHGPFRGAPATLLRLEARLRLAWPFLAVLLEPVHVYGTFVYHIYGFVACRSVAVTEEPLARAAAFQLAAAMLVKAAHTLAASASHHDAAAAAVHAAAGGSKSLAAALVPLVERAATPGRENRKSIPPQLSRPPSSRQSTSALSEQIEEMLDIKRLASGRAHASASIIEPAASLGPQHRTHTRYSHSFRRLRRQDSVASVDNGGLAHFHNQQQQQGSGPGQGGGGHGTSRLAGNNAPRGMPPAWASDAGMEAEAEDSSDNSVGQPREREPADDRGPRPPAAASPAFQRVAAEGRSPGAALRRMSSLPSRLRHVAPASVVDEAPSAETSGEERRTATPLGGSSMRHRRSPSAVPASPQHSSFSMLPMAAGFDGARPRSPPIHIVSSAPDVVGAFSAANSSMEGGGSGISGYEGSLPEPMHGRLGGAMGSAEGTGPHGRASSLGLAVGAKLVGGGVSGSAASDCLRKEALRQMVMARWRSSLAPEAAASAASSTPGHSPQFGGHALGPSDDAAMRATSPPLRPGSYLGASSVDSLVEDDGGASVAAESSHQWPSLPPATAAAAAALAAVEAYAEELRSHSPRTSVGGVTIATGTGGATTGTASALTGNSRRSLVASSRNTSIKTTGISRINSLEGRGSGPAAAPGVFSEGVGGLVRRPLRWWLLAAAAVAESVWSEEAGAVLLLLLAVIVRPGAAAQRHAVLAALLQRRASLGLAAAAGCALLALSEGVFLVGHLLALWAAPGVAPSWGVALWSSRVIAAPPLHRLALGGLGLEATVSRRHAAWRSAFYMAGIRMSASQYGRCMLASVAALAAGALLEHSHQQQHRLAPRLGLSDAGAGVATPAPHLAAISTLHQALQLLCASTAGVAMGLMAARVLPALLAGLCTSEVLRRRLSPAGADRAAGLASFLLADSPDALASGASVAYLLLAHSPLLACAKLLGRAYALLSAALSSCLGSIAWGRLAASRDSGLPDIPEDLAVLGGLGALDDPASSPSPSSYTARLRLRWLQMLLHSFPLPAWLQLLRPAPGAMAAAGMFALLLLLVAAQSLLLAMLTGDSRRAASLHRRQAALAALKLRLLQAPSVMDLLQSIMDGAAEVLEGASAWAIIGPVSRVYGACSRLSETVLLSQPTPTDLAQLAAGIGAAGLLVVPLECLEQPYGVVVIATAQAASMDKDLRLLSLSLADGLAQALYLKQMQADMAASEMVMQDIYPQHAVQALKRRMHAQGAAAGSRSLAPLTLPPNGSLTTLSALTGVAAGPGSPLVDRTMFHTANSLSVWAGGAGSSPAAAAAQASSPFSKQTQAPPAFAANLFRPAPIEQHGGLLSPRQPPNPSAVAQAEVQGAAAASAGEEGGSALGGALGNAICAALPSDVPYAVWHPAVSVLFADIVGYTATSQALEPEQVMALLHSLFCKYDALLGKHRVYKVETIGDCFMAATGLALVPGEPPNPDHALDMVRFGRAMIAAAAEASSTAPLRHFAARTG